MISNSLESKHNKTILAVYEANNQVELFIKELKEDLDSLKGECFQRHQPEYYEEVEYYNWFHQNIPQSLILSDYYKMFIHLYGKEKKSLFDCISAFIEEYESENNNEHK